MEIGISKYIQNRIIKKNQNEQLKIINKKNTLVYPNFNGFQLGFLIFFCFTASIFYQINFALLISIIIFFIYFFSIIVSFQNLNQLQLNYDYQLVEAGTEEKIKIQLKNLSNTKKLNINLKEKSGNPINIKTIENSQIIDFPVFFKERGNFFLPIINIFSDFPFGIIRCSSYWKFEKEITVYPKPIKPKNEILYQFKLDNQNSSNYEFDYIDDYKVGENQSRIAWKQSITKNKLLSKKFTSEEKLSNVLIDIEKLEANSFESKLSYASYLVINLFEKKIPFSLKNKKFSMPFSCELDHRNKALRYLSNVKN